MWTVQREYPETGGTLQFRFFAGNDCLSYKGFLLALERDANFRDVFLEEIPAAPLIAFRWENPPLTANNIEQQFECLLHDSPDLDVRADPTDFESYFRPDTEVVCFNNLGAVALLVVPCPISASVNYSHIGAFHRSAPQGQLHTFWKVVAQSVLARLGPQPLWLSTAGGGVDWLHMRLDDRPKYYRHLPWRDWRKA